jgi:S-formylglutathione hydrolase FrmB
MHGIYGSHWAWTLKAGVHRVAAAMIERGDLPPLALAMPSDGLFGVGSAYVDHAGGRFGSWILDEVPELAVTALDCVTLASPLALVGLSMGGFGALLLGARNGDRVRAAAGMSSVTDFADMDWFPGDPDAYGVAREDRSLLDAIVANRSALPAIHFDCGTSDALISANRALHKALDNAGVAHSYGEFPGGHAWPYWEARIGPVLQLVARSF